jgi:hypothetical protein
MAKSDNRPLSLDYPELIIGIAGPIGVDMDLIARGLEAALDALRYTSTLFKLTSEMSRYPITDPGLLAESKTWEDATLSTRT